MVLNPFCGVTFSVQFVVDKPIPQLRDSLWESKAPSTIDTFVMLEIETFFSIHLPEFARSGCSICHAKLHYPVSLPQRRPWHR